MPIIQILTGALAGKTFELSARELIIGRNPNCDIVLPETTISRRHARIRREGEEYLLDDLGSQHGTFINGQRITGPKRLVNGDRIKVSQGEMAFIWDDPLDFDADNVLESEHSSTIVTMQDVLAGTATGPEVNSAAKLKALLEIMHNLGVSLDPVQMYPKILDSVFRIFPQADRAYVVLANWNKASSEPRLDVAAMKLRSEGDQRVNPISRTVARRVMSDGAAILSSDASQDVRFVSSDSIHGLKLRSVMCAPLIGMERKPVGMIQVDTLNPVRQFTPDDLDVLVNIANLTAQSLEHARLHASQVQYHRRERDIEIARQVQLHFLPREEPRIPNYELCHYYSAAEGVGGDYFGYMKLADGRTAISMGDVAGKGIAAALLMARLCSEVRYALVTHKQANGLVEFLNQQFTRAIGYNSFITFALCILDPIKHELVVVNAGHMPPLLRRATDGSVDWLGNDITGPPLGIDADLSYQQTTVRLAPGDIVCLYTDGVNESTDGQGHLFGIERIEQVMQNSIDAQSAMTSLVKSVQDYVSPDKQDDDICVVCFSRNRL